MSRDDIIHMAVDAGCSAGMQASLILGQERDLEWLRRFSDIAITEFLQRTGQYVTNDASRDAAIQEAVAAEREACAQVSEGYPHGHELKVHIARAIRARGTPCP